MNKVLIEHHPFHVILGEILSNVPTNAVYHNQVVQSVCYLATLQFCTSRY